MTDTRWKQCFDNYVNSLVEFEKLVNAKPVSEYSVIERTALIKFFEISNQLAVDVMKDYLTSQGIIKQFPKEVIREAFKRELIADGQIWIDILEGRNKAAHSYNEKQAKELAREIADRFFNAFKEFADYFGRIDDNET